MEAKVESEEVFFPLKVPGTPTAALKPGSREAEDDLDLSRAGGTPSTQCSADDVTEAAPTEGAPSDAGCPVAQGSDAGAVQEPQSGNLFLTCLRLRFEERGSWSQAIADPSSISDAGSDRCAGAGEGGEGGEGEAAAAAGAEKRFEDLGWKQDPDEPQEDASPNSKASWRARVGLPPRGATRQFLRRHVKRLSGKFRPELQFCTSRAFDGSRRLRCANFGRAGARVELIGDDEGDLVIASQQTASPVLTDALAITAQRLWPTVLVHSDAGARTSVQQHFFELEVLELVRGTARSLSLGFSWADDAEEGTDEETSLSMPPLVGAAGLLPHAFVVGGELPRAHLCGKCLEADIAWRPIIHLTEGSHVGVMLELAPAPPAASGEDLERWLDEAAMASEAAELRLSVWQDGVRRAEVLGRLSWADEGRLLHRVLADPTRGVRGVVDLCGSVRRVRLCGAS